MKNKPSAARAEEEEDEPGESNNDVFQNLDKLMANSTVLKRDY